MKITKESILSWKPCDDWTEEVISNLIKKHCGRRKIIKFSDIVSAYHGKDLEGSDFCWLVLRPEIIPDRKLHEIAIFCWDQIARPIWEKYYPDDKRPHEAVRIKKLWLNGKATDKELSASSAAALDAARAAACHPSRDAASIAASIAAGYAAWDAVRDAAWDAAWDASWATAGFAARDAARVAARDAAYKKIVTYIMRIMK